MSLIADLMALRASQAEPVTEAEDNLDPDTVANAVEELEDLHKQLVSTMQEVQHVVRGLPRTFRGAAEAYWVPHILIALGGEHGYMAGHSTSMQDTINEMREYADGGPGDEDDES